jgi:hypothetical protein
MLSRNFKLFFTSFLLVTLVVSSCKKTTTEPDDPNIIYNGTPKTVACLPMFTTFDTLDLNGDGMAEMAFNITNMGGDTGLIQLTSYTQPAGFAIEELVPAPIVKIYNKGDAAPLSASVYLTSPFATFKTSGYRKGLVNGEGYMAFRFTTASNYNYGWMHVSVNNSLTEFTILEYAYNAIPGKGITIGAK